MILNLLQTALNGSIEYEIKLILYVSTVSSLGDIQMGDVNCVRYHGNPNDMIYTHITLP